MNGSFAMFQAYTSAFRKPTIVYTREIKPCVNVGDPPVITGNVDTARVVEDATGSVFSFQPVLSQGGGCSPQVLADDTWVNPTISEFLSIYPSAIRIYSL